MPLPIHYALSTSHPLTQKDAEPILLDSEQYIRQAFDIDVRRGYEALFRRYYALRCGHAARFVYSREIAEDLVSDVFLKFWKNQTHDHIIGSFRAYLFTAVRHTALNFLEQELRRDGTADPLLHETDIPAAADDDPQQILLCTELYNRLDDEVRSLPSQCQRVFMMSRFDGKRHREIAKELRISPKTVEAHLMKSLAHLRKTLPALSALWWLFDGF